MDIFPEYRVIIISDMGPGFLFEGEKSFDSLTHVYNREVLVSYINFLSTEKVPFSMLIVDVDNFKYINDTYGYAAGEKILIEVADRLREVVGDRGTIGRFAGHDFMIVFPDISSYEDIWQECRQILSIVNSAEMHDITGLFVSVTVGVSRFPENGSTYEELLETADKALYRGKLKGRNCFIIYLPEKHADIDISVPKETSISSMYLHTIVFRLLNTNPDKNLGIETLFNFLSSYFSIDHYCIQKGDKVYFPKVHDLSPSRKILPIDLELMRENLSASSEFFYINQMDSLSASHQIKLAEQLMEQQINAAFCCKIQEDEDGELFVLRAESVKNHEWTYGEMDIYVTAAKVIGMLYQDKKLDF